MQLHFTKMHGLGNDFVVINNLHQDYQFNPQQLQRLADRHFGIGCDQFLILEKASDPNADFFYRIYNADGNEVNQCGNGARAMALFIAKNKLAKKNNIVLQTRNGQLQTKIIDKHEVQVNIGKPIFNPRAIPFLADKEKTQYEINGFQCSVLSVGNPHCVIVVNDLNTVDVAQIGAQLTKHSVFPEQANIGFMQVIDRQHIKLKVFERGAGLTLACGSGAAAAVVAGIRLHLLDEQVDVALTAGHLQVHWQDQHAIIMQGNAEFVFEGTFSFT